MRGPARIICTGRIAPVVSVVLFICLVAAPVLAGDPDSDGDGRPDFVDGEIVVQFEEDVSEVQGRTIIEEKGCTMMEYIRKLRAARVGIPGKEDVLPLISDFARHPGVKLAEPNFIYYPHVVPDDPRVSDQWALGRMELFDAWDLERGESSGVIIAIIDTGVDYFHEDLEANIWVNPGEDLDHDGVVWDQDDMNGDDDDQNGFVDDLVGWNFVSFGDNDPMDDDEVSSHGTHCAGIASGVTDNGIGIAGSGWQCKIMCMKGMGAGGSGSNYDLAECIDYAWQNGAHCLSMSWGNYTPAGLLYDAILDAYTAGSLLFSSAGNDDTDDEGYPAAYYEVVAVASTDEDDTKSSFSNYGLWVQICAPGSSILSTILDDNYTRLSGTSMSCPYAAGVTALMKSQNPDSSRTWILDQLYSTADDINSLNPGYEGKLGAGRINAFTLVGSHLYPNLYVTDISLDDSSGNGDGRPDPGETVLLSITLENDRSPWKDATGVSAVLRTDSGTITVTDSTKSYGDMPVESVVTRTFSFEVSPTSEAHLAGFTLAISSQPNDYETAETFELMISRPQVLLVDDDSGDAVETWYEDHLDVMLNRIYDLWEVNESGDLPQSEMDLYDLLIWCCGSRNGTVANDTTALKGYLDGGGQLFMVNQYLETLIGSSAFYADYLHASPLDDYTGEWIFNGTDGDPVGDGFAGIVNAGTGGANNAVSPGAVEPVGGAQASFYYYTSENPCVVLYDGHDYRTIYWATSFEAITSPETREAIIARTFEVFDIDYEEGILSIGLEAEVAPDGIILSWRDHRFGQGSGTVLYRAAQGEEFVQTGPHLFPAGGRREYLDRDVSTGCLYRYRLTVVEEGCMRDSHEISILFSGPPGVAAMSSYLQPAAPNPFNPVTVIRYRVGIPEDPGARPYVKLDIYDISGRHVASLVDGLQEAGNHSVRWTARDERGKDLPSGVYFCTLRVNDFRRTNKLLLLK